VFLIIWIVNLSEHEEWKWVTRRLGMQRTDAAQTTWAAHKLRELAYLLAGILRMGILRMLGKMHGNDTGQ